MHAQLNKTVKGLDSANFENKITNLAGSGYLDTLSKQKDPIITNKTNFYNKYEMAEDG